MLAEQKNDAEKQSASCDKWRSYVAKTGQQRR
jgi:hypothetical protein